MLKIKNHMGPSVTIRHRKYVYKTLIFTYIESYFFTFKKNLPFHKTYICLLHVYDNISILKITYALDNNVLIWRRSKLQPESLRWSGTHEIEIVSVN